MKKKGVFYLLLLFIYQKGISQGTVDFNNIAGQEQIITATPFLTINPDPRGAALGDVGVASSSDASSIHWNVSKIVQSKDQFGVMFSITPWLRNLNISDINLFYLSGFNKFDTKHGLAYSLRYFNFGDIVITGIDANSTAQGRINPYEFALDVGYSRLLHKTFSLGLTFRYIRSDITQEQYNTQTANGFSVDLGGLWKNKYLVGKNKFLHFGIGFNFSNIGTKIAYSGNDKQQFLPSLMRLGTSLMLDLYEFHKLEFSFDINKLLVPSNTVSNSNLDVFSAIGQSFAESSDIQIKQIAISLGLEYNLMNLLSIRTGYYHEDQLRGNRQFLSIGAGIFYRGVRLDVSYLFTTNNIQSPISNTFRLGLSYFFSTKKYISKFISETKDESKSKKEKKVEDTPTQKEEKE